jgi:predicted esterase
MLKISKILLICSVVFICMSIIAVAQNAPAAGVSASASTTPLAPGVSRVTSPPVGKTAGQSRRTGGDPVDDRVELREYLFTDTNEILPYAVFVSSKVTKDKKAPIVLALHGMGGNHGTFMRTQCVDEAEKNGFILIGAMGYSPNGPFGMNFGMGGLRRGTGTPGGRRGFPGAAAGGVPGAAMAGGMPNGMIDGRGGRGMMGRGRGPTLGGTKETDSARVAELSEKDAMNVLEMARKEFNVDDNRIYLMGHSLGGGGALHMGEKYADLWAGVAGCAPAAFGFTWTAESKLKNVPLFIIAGDADTLVTGSKQMVDQMKGLGFNVQFKSMPGVDHGGIIGDGMPDVFKFFNENIKGQPKQ